MVTKIIFMMNFQLIFTIALAAENKAPLEIKVLHNFSKAY